MPTLEDLENDVWDDTDLPTNLVRRCHALRKKDIDQFDVGDFRILLGQGIGAPHLARPVLAILEQEPLAEGAFYPGDLLQSALNARNWPAFEPWPERLEAICRAARIALPEEPKPYDDGTASAEMMLVEAIANYLNRRSRKH